MTSFVEFFASSALVRALLTLVPIVGWIYFFQMKHHEKRSYVVLSFLAGMVAVFPIKLYEKYWDRSVFFFEHTNLFTYISELLSAPSAATLLSYITVNALVALGLYVFALIMMGALELFTGDNTLKVFERKVKISLESPVFYMLLGVVVGVLAYFFSFSLEQQFYFYVVVGMMEEFIKHLVLRFSDEEKILSVDDAISYAIIVALGFSFVENILYFNNFVEVMKPSGAQFWLFFLLRSTISVLAHIAFSAIFAYFYGLAKFSKAIYTEEARQGLHPWIIRMKDFLRVKGYMLYHDQKMFEGLFLAMIIHAIFNLFLEFNYIHLVLPMILGLFIIVLNLFHRKNIRVVQKPYITT